MSTYLLNKMFAFRGWDRLPYAITDARNGQTVFLNENEFDALSLCNGTVDVDSTMVLQVQRDIIMRAVAEGYVIKCDGDERLDAWQKYKLHSARYIKSVFWSLTGRCNYSCKHCCLSAGDGRYGELCHKQCAEIIAQMRDCGITQVSLTGGEPLVRADFFDIVDKLLASKVTIKQIYTNGRLVTPQFLDKLIQRGCRPVFHMSFDGVGWHDWLRGVEGAERAVLDAFEFCRDLGFSSGASMTIHRRNMHTLRASVNLLSKLGVATLKVNPVASSGAWLRNSVSDSVTVQDMFQLYLDYIPHFFNDGSPLTLMLGGFFKASKGGREYGMPSIKFDGTCDAVKRCVCAHARANLYISPDGRALPCLPMASVENASKCFPLVQECGLVSCLSDSTYMRFIDTRLSAILAHNEECARCDYGRYCGGGCRAAALDGGGADVLGIDRSTCVFFKEMWPERIVQKVKSSVCGHVKHPVLPFGLA